MESAELRNMAAELRRIAAQETHDRVKKASEVLDAAVALRILQQKVRIHG